MKWGLHSGLAISEINGVSLRATQIDEIDEVSIVGESMGQNRLICLTSDYLSLVFFLFFSQATRITLTSTWCVVVSALLFLH